MEDGCVYILVDRDGVWIGAQEEIVVSSFSSRDVVAMVTGHVGTEEKKLRTEGTKQKDWGMSRDRCSFKRKTLAMINDKKGSLLQHIAYMVYVHF